jgi:hypothetical protein
MDQVLRTGSGWTEHLGATRGGILVSLTTRVEERIGSSSAGVGLGRHGEWPIVVVICLR